MPQRPTIRLRLNRLTYTALAAFAQTIHTGLTGSTDYPTPNPALASFQTDITALNTAITAWGTVGNRGSHAALVALLAAAQQVRNDLTALSMYVQDTTPYDETKWIPVGFETKNPNSPVGILQKVQDLRQFISRDVPSGQIKMKWERPLASPVAAVKSYKVFRNASPVFDPAAAYVTVTKTSFLDNGTSVLGAVPQTPVYYWVVPVNAYGDGNVSDISVAQAIFTV